MVLFFVFILINKEQHNTKVYINHLVSSRVTLTGFPLLRPLYIQHTLAIHNLDKMYILKVSIGVNLKKYWGFLVIDF